MRHPLLVALLALSALAGTATGALAATETRTVPGELRFEYGASPDDPGNCSAIVFIQWSHVPGTTGAVAWYTWRGREFARAKQPPFDDLYEWVRTYQVAHGFHWIQVGKGWADGHTPNDCSETSAKQKADYSLEPDATRVDLTIEPPTENEECKAARRSARRARRVRREAGKRLRAAQTRKARRKAEVDVRLARLQVKRARERVRRSC